jgi:predicted O-methyltransferase YrrM
VQASEFERVVAQLHAQHETEKVPSISPSNAAFLCSLLRAIQPKNILEIGTCHGLSACHFAHTALAWGGQVTTLELSPLNYANALQTFALFDFANLRALRCDASDYLAARRTKAGAAPFDWVFIDAQKSKTLDFYLAIQGQLAPQATIVVDDASKHALKMQPFYEYLHANGVAYSLHEVDADDATLVIRC